MIRAITGLPRTRTYWFSKFFKTGIHEPYNRLVLKADSIICDSSFIHRFNDIEDQGSKRRIVVINRPPSDSWNSYRLFQLETPIFPYLPPAWFRREAERLAAIEGLHVNYEDIDEYLPRICQYLGEPYDKERHSRLKGVILTRSYS